MLAHSSTNKHRGVDSDEDDDNVVGLEDEFIISAVADSPRLCYLSITIWLNNWK